MKLSTQLELKQIEAEELLSACQKSVLSHSFAPAEPDEQVAKELQKKLNLQVMQISSLNESLCLTRQQEQSKQRQLGKAQQELTLRGQQVEALRQQLATTQAGNTKLKQDLDDTATQLATVSTELDQAKEMLSESQSQVSQISADKAELQREITELTEALKLSKTRE